MEFNTLFPKHALKVLHKFPPNRPIIFDDRSQTYSVLDTTEFRELQSKFNQYCDRICLSSDGAVRIRSLEYLLKMLLMVDFAWILVIGFILKLACRKTAHERTLYVIVELMADLDAGRYTLGQLDDAARELRGGADSAAAELKID